jgi:hypothetical protein
LGTGKGVDSMQKKIALFLFGLASVSPLSAAMPSVFPPINGWVKTGEIQTFSPDNLYEYINGAADLYLKYEFQELQVAEYQGSEKASITVEVYRHKTPFMPSEFLARNVRLTLMFLR